MLTLAREELAELADMDAVKAARARRRLLNYARRMYPAYREGRHHVYIAEALEEVEAGRCRFLIIEAPPRHGKSELASVQFPSWYLGRNPDKRVIGASYAAALANGFSRRARNQVQAEEWPFSNKTAGDLAQVERWDMDGHRGGYIAAGVGGGITGQGADLLIIDDPFKDAAEANSETIRENVWEWYQSTAFTRLHPGGAVVVIATRWHEDDLIGRLLAAEDGAKWTRVHLPALAEDNDQLGRIEGEALWPERYSQIELQRIKVQIGTYFFSALYQQRPAAIEGQIIRVEWWDHVDVPPLQVSWIIQAWDTAFKTKKENDYSACATLATAYDGYHLLDMWHGKVEFPDLERAVRSQYLRWRPNEVLVEDAGSGQSLIQVIERGIDGTSPWHSFGTGSDIVMPIIPVPTDRDKLARVHAVTPYFEAHRIKVPAGALWVENLIAEFAAFPYGKHDDQVDAVSIAILRAAEHTFTMGHDADGLDEWFDKMGA